jgi:hypothetical protein
MKDSKAWCINRRACLLLVLLECCLVGANFRELRQCEVRRIHLLDHFDERRELAGCHCGARSIPGMTTSSESVWAAHQLSRKNAMMCSEKVFGTRMSAKCSWPSSTSIRASGSAAATVSMSALDGSELFSPLSRSTGTVIFAACSGFNLAPPSARSSRVIVGVAATRPGQEEGAEGAQILFRH